MDGFVARSLLLTVFGVFAFLGLEKFLAQFQSYGWLLGIVGAVIFIYAKRVPLHTGMVRSIASVLLFIALRPYLMQYTDSYWYYFVIAGLLGIVFVDRIVSMFER